MLTSSAFLLLLHLSIVVLLMMITTAMPADSKVSFACKYGGQFQVPPQGSHERTDTHGSVDYCITSCCNLTGSVFANRDDLDLLIRKLHCISIGW